MARTKLTCFLIFMFSWWSLALRSQVSNPPSRQDSVYTLRVYQDLVIVDVVVTDKKGNPVKNLTRDNFTVYEDNVPQKISTFDFEDLSAGDSSPGELVKTNALPGPIIDLSKNAPDQLPKDLFQHRRLMILYLDLTA